MVSKSQTMGFLRNIVARAASWAGLPVIVSRGGLSNTMGSSPVVDVRMLVEIDGRRRPMVATARARGMKPNPFLRDAFNQSADASVNDFGTDLATAIERFVNRNYRKI